MMELGINNCEFGITKEALAGIKYFVTIDDKANILKMIDDIIETGVRSGFVEDKQMSTEFGLLYDFKRLVNCLPFKH